ncbi:hypothetical protein A3F07_04625 [candidate division WWE3 bacterium RIFCSPHIGHO2_12_FULL_38_15]|uniref:Uncharacterized protein n=1 Tax=candidate division WWE3 bacterium RIFCSPHIGHO2_02_FULL_38_14 TaxID=1802620 RepID=A0A1F4V9E8_UNCKA|nr:MAG: hypothetical protein A2793_00255 [candidate division WWE3 bacterium RIFCSPHIGHO2_01_FULL_38_45]OGC49526.1 MAG: hypothetical protein A3F07_04625 [candidate division WWE3 bacterium RIFCSPHIGHO2_12_FULL_38_15]OGC52515.1 MAG: hypothetical protein A3B64_04670 [candidate division WWE3 bacterium RIFCSPLOWO2_01_FULL_37_24]OGC53283.1 MAG: hypothetical protein A3D91_02620 [candidate division WWE3 bacterium RIFCSPHIGHO2_02_FULL_38_14]HLB51790.1 poly-gamma-glutamate biosynthesis protein PgsC/CapC [
MQINLDNIEILSLILCIGVITATIIRRRTGINPGGIITSPFMVISFIFSPLWGITLLVLGYIVYKIYNRFFTQVYFGRYPMYITGILSIVLVYATALIYTKLNLVSQMNLNHLYGLIVPAIIAMAIRKQGPEKTYKYTVLSTLISGIIFSAVYLAITAIFKYDFYEIEGLREGLQDFSLNNSFILILVSILVSFVIYYFTKIKSGGYIVLPYLAVLAFYPKNLLIFALSLLFLIWIVKLLKHYTLVVGITRYTLVLCVAIVLVGTIETYLLRNGFTISPFMGANIFPALALAAIANDFAVQKTRKTIPYLALNLAVVGIVYFFLR